MNENINLCEILKGLEGIELYSTIHGRVKITKICNCNCEYPIEYRTIESDLSFGSVTSKGLHYKYSSGECTLFPSKSQRDWSKFERPIPIGTPMMCSNTDLRFFLGYYKIKRASYHTIKYMEVPGIFRGFGVSIKPDCTDVIYPYYVIPFDKFNPNNIEESLKYNIQK